MFNFRSSRTFVEDQLCLEHYYIPTAKQRRRLSNLALAELVARPALAAPAKVLVEHELNMRLAREQSNATWKAAAYGAVGAMAAAALGAWLTGAFQKQDGQTCVCQWGSKEEVPNHNLKEQPPSVSAPKPILSPAVQATGQPKP